MYKKHAGVPKVVIYGVDYFIYTVKSDPRWLSQFQNANKGPKINFFSSPLLLLENKKKMDNFQNNILIRLQEEKVPRDNKQYFKDFIDIQEHMGGENPGKKLISKEPPEYLRQYFPLPPGEEGDYFMKLLDELDRDDVTVILVALPDYYGSFKTNFQMREFINQLKSIRPKYKKLFIYNYNRPDQFPLDNPDYFIDGGYGMTNSHLSISGAKVFDEMLCEDIKKYYQ
jgi:hypothetical protein